MAGELLAPPLVAREDLRRIRKFIAPDKGEERILDVVASPVTHPALVAAIEADFDQDHFIIVIQAGNYVQQGFYQLDQLFEDVETQLRKRFETPIPDPAAKAVGLIRHLQPPLIVLTGAEDIPEEQLSMFEELFLAPVAQQPHVKTVVISARKIYWKDFVVRMRTQEHKATSLTISDIAMALPALKDLAPQLFKWSGDGEIPELVLYLAKRCQELRISKADEFITHQGEIINIDYYDRVLHTVFSDPQPQDYWLLSVLGVMRNRNTTVLSQVLPAMDKMLFPTFTQRDLLQVMDRFGGRFYGRYGVHTFLQKIIREYFFTYDQPTYNRIQRAIIKALFDKFHEEHQAYELVELLYHWSLVATPEELPELQNFLAEALKQVTNLPDFRERVSQDPELQQLQPDLLGKIEQALV